jgi:spore coat polysaccharide biosynthesis protein SpsF
MKTGVFLQARIPSVRLNGKALLPLQGISTIQHVMRALLPVKADTHVLLTDQESRDSLAPYADAEGFQIFVGPSEDVLLRYCRAAEAYGVRRIIRATGDNPLVSAEMADRIVDIHERKAADLSHYLGLPLGTGVEVAQTDAMRAAEKASTDPLEREHIMMHLYRHRDRFRVVEEPCPPELSFPDIHVSLDTEDDYRFLSRIYRDLYENEPIDIRSLARWLRENRELVREMRTG